MAMESPAQIPRQRIQELIEREETQLNERHAGLARDVRARPRPPVRRRRLVLPAARSVADLPRARRRPEGLGRRRQRDVRLPQRLRLDGPGPRPPGDRRRRSASATRTGTHFAAPTEDAIVVGDELARRWGLPKWRYTNSGSESTMDAIRIARGYTGRDDDHEDLRLLPRPPRRRDGLDRRRVRQDRRPREPRLAALRRRHPAGRRRPDDRRAVQRRRARWSAASSA